MHTPPFRPTRILHTLALLLAVGVAATASAMSLRELRALEKSGKQGMHYANYYLVGVMEGSLESLAHGTRNGAAPAVCLNGRRLAPPMARSLYETELQRNGDLYEADMPVQLVLLNALIAAYTCAD